MSIPLVSESFTLHCHLHVTSSQLGFKRTAADVEKDTMTVSIESYHKKMIKLITVLLYGTCYQSTLINNLFLESKSTMKKCLRSCEMAIFINLQSIKVLGDKLSAKVMN